MHCKKSHFPPGFPYSLEKDLKPSVNGFTSQMMCAGLVGGGNDSFQGDSGDEMGIVQP